MEVRLLAARGTLTLSDTTSPIFIEGDGTNDPTMTFTGTIPDLNLALDGLSFDPERDYNGSDSLEIVMVDLGHTGLGGPKNDTDTVIIVVRPVNDVPEVSGLPFNLTIFEGEARRIDLDPVVSDVETAPADMSWAGVSSDGVIADSDIDPARAVIIDAKDNGTADVTLIVTDRGDPDNCGLPSESCDGPESANHVIQVNVNNVPPTIALSGAPNVDEGSVYVLTLGTVTDPGDDAVSQYIVRWGDNRSDTYSSAGDVTHIYADGPESHVISVDLVDEDGTHTDAGSLPVDVENVAPEVELTGANVADEQGTNSYSFASSDPGDDTFNLISQSCGLNGILSNPTFDISSGAGSFDCTFPDGFARSSVSVQVADSDGLNSDPDTFVVTMNNVDPVVEAGDGQIVDEGSTVELNQSAFSDSGFDFPSAGTFEDFTGTVNWGDETPTELSGVSETPGGVVVDTTGTVSSSHVYADDGSYTVTVCVTDDDSGSGCDTFTVTVNNVDPSIISVGNDGPIDEGNSAIITVVATDPARALDPLSYEYDCNNDLTYDTGPQPGSNASCDFSNDGSFVVNVRVTDGDGGLATASTTVIVNNVLPTVEASGPYTVDEGGSVDLSGTCGGCVSFLWDLDGTQGFETPGPTPTFNGPFVSATETRTVELQVTDSDGDTATDTAQITINNIVPVVSAGGPYSVDEGDSVQVSGTCNGCASTEWDVDGQPGFEVSSSVATFSAAALDGPSTRTVTFRGCDADGDCETSSSTLTIENVAPTANTDGPYSVNEGSTVGLRPTGTDASPADTLSFTWDLDNDGFFETSGQDVSFDATLRDGPDSQVVVVQVCDDDGDCGTSNTTVTINNVAPTADADGPYSVNEGSSASLSGSGFDASPNDVLSFAWDLNNDGVFETAGQNPSFSAALRDGPSSQTVVLQVCDDDGGCNTSNSSVTIVNVAPSINAVRDDGPIFEGSSVTVTVVAIDPAGELDPPSYEYDCDNDLTYDIGPQPASSAPCEFSDEGSFVVNVRVTDGDGGETTASTTVTIFNADPVMTAVGAAIDEGQSATVNANFTDEGTLDIHTATIDWGDSTAPQAVAVAQGSGFGSLSASHVYSDNGDYSVIVTVTDDDTGVGASTVTVSVNNLNPSLTLNLGDAVAFGTEQVFLGRKDDPQTHSADASDPGSDDLTFNWDFEIATASQIHHNNGSTPEPVGSPSPQGTFPFSPSDSACVTCTTPGIYSVTVEAVDDDGGQSGTQSLTKIVTDDCDCTKSKGFWKEQFKERKPKDQTKVEKGQLIAEDVLDSYLDIVNLGSSVFTADVLEDGVPLSTLAEAHLILSGKAGGPAAPQVPQSVTQDISTESKKKKKGDGTGSKDNSDESKSSKKKSDNSKGSKKKSDESKESKAGSESATSTTKIKGQALSQLLAAWLNYAKGAIELEEDLVIDTGETGSGSDTSSESTPPVTMSFEEIIAEVEAILNNPDATKADLERAKDLAESVNQHDKNNPDCDTHTRSDRGSETGSK